MQNNFHFFECSTLTQVKEWMQKRSAKDLCSLFALLSYLSDLNKIEGIHFQISASQDSRLYLKIKTLMVIYPQEEGQFHGWINLAFFIFFFH